jgi:Predicted GTPase, probable translation factor
MIRCFDSADIQNVNPSVDPIRDLEIIETEMMLADIESLQKRLDKKNKKNIDEKMQKVLKEAFEMLNSGKDLSKLINEVDEKIINQTGLLSIKPKIYVCNVDEKSVNSGNNYTNDFIAKFGPENTIIISADIENQINQFEMHEKKNYMNMIELKETGLNKLISKGYNILNLETFFTSGPEESRAWTIKKNCIAPSAAGEIHTDFEKGFIRAETVSYEDFVRNGGWLNSKNNGNMRLEGKDYIVKDGDVLNFRFNT